MSSGVPGRIMSGEIMSYIPTYMLYIERKMIKLQLLQQHATCHDAVLVNSVRSICRCPHLSRCSAGEFRTLPRCPYLRIHFSMFNYRCLKSNPYELKGDKYMNFKPRQPVTWVLSHYMCVCVCVLRYTQMFTVNRSFTYLMWKNEDERGKALKTKQSNTL